MKRKYACLWLAVLTGLPIIGGCNGTVTENSELKGQVKKLETMLEATENERDLLTLDVKRLTESLDQAESRLADTSDSRNKLQAQVQDLTKSGEELRTRVDSLGAARAQLQEKVAELSTARDQLQTRVEDLTGSRDELQRMVESLVDTRGLLEKQVASLTKARDAARQDAKTAQVKMEQLNGTLKAQTEQMTELQAQVATIRSVLEQLQQKLE